MNQSIILIIELVKMFDLKVLTKIYIMNFQMLKIHNKLIHLNQFILQPLCKR